MLAGCRTSFSASDKGPFDTSVVAMHPGEMSEQWVLPWQALLATMGSCRHDQAESADFCVSRATDGLGEEIADRATRFRP